MALDPRLATHGTLLHNRHTGYSFFRAQLRELQASHFDFFVELKGTFLEEPKRGARTHWSHGGRGKRRDAPGLAAPGGGGGRAREPGGPTGAVDRGPVQGDRGPRPVRPGPLRAGGEGGDEKIGDGGAGGFSGGDHARQDGLRRDGQDRGGEALHAQRGAEPHGGVDQGADPRGGGDPSWPPAPHLQGAEAGERPQAFERGEGRCRVRPAPRGAQDRGGVVR
mmetsp:Transcript_34040/g.76896  ORF Transcript_34040/g.76896 Transcript_34040/m.76896 type:complete len:222 (+) Transcript_34040:15-680(+)